MLLLSALFYSISLLCQVGAAAFSIGLIKSTTYIYRWAWLSLALGLTLMLGRRISPLLNIYTTGQYNFTDAVLSVPISGLLLLGVIGIRKIIFQINSNNSLLLTLSQLDPLTQCFSRTEIFYRITEEIERSRRSNHSFALLEMDIDHFKNVNDQYGHDVGDEVLIGLVRNAKDVMRKIDSVGRIGGEEFLILLPETGVEEAMLAAERLRSHIANTTDLSYDIRDLKITISIGVTVFHPQDSLRMQKGEVLAEIIKQADIAMYEAKNTGRNRVAIWKESS